MLKQQRRNRTPMIIGIGTLLTLIALATIVAMSVNTMATHAGGVGDSGVVPKGNNNQNNTTQNTGNNNQNNRVTNINGLMHISVVGSTQFIVDGHGKTLNVDANPYGIAIAPASTPKSTAAGALHAGDLVVTNFGANQKGMTLVRFPGQKGPGQLFNVAMNKGTLGPADEAFNTLTGTNWVANTSGNNVQIFQANGTIMATVVSPLFKMPWGQAFNNGVHNKADGSVASFFSSNAADGTIDRIDVIPVNGKATFKVFQIGQLAHMGQQTFIALLWLPSLQLRGQLFKDVLLATDPVDNSIVAYPNSTTRNTSANKATDKGTTVFKGMPLRAPAGFTVNPANGDLLVVNMQRNDLVELSPAQGKVAGVRLIDNVPVDAQGNGSALFGVAATTDEKGNLKVFFTDDNTNTINMLSI